MSLTVGQQKLLAYCRQPRTSEQIAEHLGLATNTVYKSLRLLQRLGLLDKHTDAPNKKARYEAVDLGGRTLERHLDELMSASHGYVQYKGVPAHNPFNL
jgi:predicted transcriptional regulator